MFIKSSSHQKLKENNINFINVNYDYIDMFCGPQTLQIIIDSFEVWKYIFYSIIIYGQPTI